MLREKINKNMTNSQTDRDNHRVHALPIVDLYNLYAWPCHCNIITLKIYWEKNIFIAMFSNSIMPENLSWRTVKKSCNFWFTPSHSVLIQAVCCFLRFCLCLINLFHIHTCLIIYSLLYEEDFLLHLSSSFSSTLFSASSFCQYNLKLQTYFDVEGV